MQDYDPMDISRWCNSGAGVLEEESPTLGRQSLLGLPFLVGQDDGEPDGACFIDLKGGDAPVAVAVGRSALRVVFAHRLLESKLAEGGPLGVDVAEYVFHLADGSVERAAIRERFEIAGLSGRGGLGGRAGMPYLAVPDHGAEPMPRTSGPWDAMGRRQFEAESGLAQHYYLWAWENPRREQSIDAIEIVPKGPRFLVVGITLGSVDENPLVRTGRRPVKLVLKDAERARRPFDLDVEVDRGENTYAFALPRESSDQFVGDPFKGWGQAPNRTSSPAYVEVSATPSATVTVKQSGEDVGSARWGDIQSGGAVETEQVRFELTDPGRNWVNVTVVDDDTGQPVPCRVHFRSPDGVPYQPHGHHSHVHSDLGTWYTDVGGDLRLGHVTYAYIDGTCQGWLPRGEVIVDAARGFEYEPLRTRVLIEPGQQELALRLKRWTNMNARRWFSGDSHVHWLSAQGSHTEARAEDLNVVNLLQSQWGNHFTNTEDFTGEPSVSKDGQSIVYVGQENRQHLMGHMLLWGLKKPVMPWCSDGLGEAEVGGTLEATLSDWADATHEQGGTAIAAHYGGLTGEAVALIATGRVRGVEFISHSTTNHRDYYQALNCGYRLPLVGGTDKMSSDVAVGSYRTYAYIPPDQEFTYDNWCAAVAAGRTFLSGGPILELTVDGQPIGSTLNMSGPGTVEVHASAESLFPIHRLEIVQAGRVVASAESEKGDRRLEVRERLRIDGHTWIAARCGGPGYLSPEAFPGRDDDAAGLQIGDYFYNNWRRGTFAHTSPIYVASGGDWWMFDPDTARLMLKLIEGGMAYMEHTTAQHLPGTTTHPHGEADHIAHLQRPFVEARQSIERRVQALGLSL